jgi:hypothetical protein
LLTGSAALRVLITEFSNRDRSPLAKEKVVSAKAYLLLAFLFLGAAAAGLPPGTASAQKAQKEDPEAAKKKADELKEQYLKDLMTAYRLKELGQDKDNPSPECLIAAARLFKRLSKVQLGQIEEKPLIEAEEKGAKLLDEAAKTPDLEEEARDLLDQARALGAERKLNLDALIKDVEQNTNTRATVGGPRHIARKIGPGQTQTFHFTILGKHPLYVGFRASAPLHTKIHHIDGTTWEEGVAPHFERAFHPLSNCKMVVKVHNPHRHQAVFQLFVN